ncbi:MAG: hypothetical protein KJ666_00650 [Bacteroidetes bacterium]|nr:hypothetical protein [Bacteroidota bacterium]
MFFLAPNMLWKKKESGSISMDCTIEEVVDKTVRYSLKAEPIGESITSPWMTAKPKALIAIKKVLGQAEYRAYEGANTGGANGIYWISINSSKGNIIQIENSNVIGRKKFKAVTYEIEKDLVFPLLRGRDVKRWIASPSAWQLVAQDPNTRRGYESKWMEKNCPKTKKYFEEFEKELKSRPAFKKFQENSTFWSQYNVGSYTFSTYKVVWKYIATEMTCAVIAGQVDKYLEMKLVIPDCKLMLVPCESENEAHYVCAILNNCISRFIVHSYAVGTQLSTHILQNIMIPKYDANISPHQDLSRLSKLCHEKVAAGIDVTDLEEQIDELAAELWGLTKQELKDIKESLEELR